MENEVLSILLGGLIVAIIFHALASRYELQRGGRDIAYRYRPTYGESVGMLYDLDDIGRKVLLWRKI